MRRDERGPWYLLTGLVLGIALGLVYAWWVQPVRYTNTLPASLQAEFKDQYRALIAAAYQGNRDPVRARARLELLHDPDLYRALSEQAQRTLAENRDDPEARALGMLAIDLGQAEAGAAPALPPTAGSPTAQVGTTLAQPTTAVLAGEPETPPAPDAQLPVAEMTPVESAPVETTIPTAPTAIETLLTPEAQPGEETAAPPAPETPPGASTETTVPPPVLPPTAVPSASALPSATPGGPFLLASREKQCDPPLEAPLIQVEALNRFNTPLPGTLVIVAWQGGEERFYTGLKPEKGPGYADFAPTPGILYTLRLGENGQPEDNLAALVCIGPGGERYWGAWVLKFVQP